MEIDVDTGFDRHFLEKVSADLKIIGTAVG